MLEDPPDGELLALKEESLGKILSAKDKVTFPCPSALYIEMSIITSDGKLVILGVFAYPPETVYSFRGDMQKPPDWG